MICRRHVCIYSPLLKIRFSFSLYIALGTCHDLQAFLRFWAQLQPLVNSFTATMEYRCKGFGDEFTEVFKREMGFSRPRCFPRRISASEVFTLCFLLHLISPSSFFLCQISQFSFGWVCLLGLQLMFTVNLIAYELLRIQVLMGF